MPGERSLDRDLGRLEVADLADHDDVGILAHDVPEPRGEGEADLRLHRDLVDALELILDGILDGDDLLVGRVDLVERAVERGRLAGARGAGHEQDPVGEGDEALEARLGLRGKAEPLERQEDGRAIEEAHHDRFTVDGRDRGHADVDAAAVQHHPNAPVLGEAALGDVHLGHDLDPRGDGRLQATRRRLLIVQHAVDAVPDAQRVLERLEVNVRRFGAERVLDDEVDEPDDRGLKGHVSQVADVLVSFARRAGVLHALHDPLQWRGRRVRPFDRLEDPFRGGDGDLDLHGEAQSQVVEEQQIRRIRGRDRERVALDRDRADAVLAEVLRRQVLQDRDRGRQLVACEEGEVGLGGERAQHVLAGDRAHRHERLAEAFPAAADPAQRALEGFEGGLACLQEDLAQEPGSDRNRHVVCSMQW